MKYLKVLFWPVMFMIGQFFIQYLFVAYFNNKYYSNVDLYNVINTVDYKLKLNDFINNYTLLIIFFIGIIFIPSFYLLYRKYSIKIKFDLRNIIYYIIIGILLALIYNLYLSIITNYQISKLPIYVQIISSGIIGPIIEELLFRGIVYNKLKQFNSVKKSMIISTIIFSIIHFSIADCIYTIFIGYLLVYVYEKYKDIRYSMVIHILINVSVILMGLVITLNIIVINIIIFVIFILILFYFILKK